LEAKTLFIVLHIIMGMYKVEYNKVHQEIRDEKLAALGKQSNHVFMLYSLNHILDIFCTWCTLYSSYAVIGVRCTWCTLFLVYTVFGGYCIW
jgi:hypothetical protein